LGRCGHALCRDYDSCVVEDPEADDPSNDGDEHHEADEKVVSKYVLDRDVVSQLLKVGVDLVCFLLAERLHRSNTCCKYCDREENQNCDDSLSF